MLLLRNPSRFSRNLLKSLKTLGTGSHSYDHSSTILLREISEPPRVQSILFSSFCRKEQRAVVPVQMSVFGGSERGCANTMDALSDTQFTELVANLDAVIFDCDGVLWIGNEAMPGAQQLVKLLRKLNKKVFFLTNNSSKTQEQFLEKFTSLGFETTMDEIIGTANLAALYLKERNFQGKVYVLGSEGITEELDKAGIPSLPIGPDPVPDSPVWITSGLSPQELDAEVKAVIVGFDRHVSLMKLIKASSYLADPNCLFIATNTDEQFPAGNGIIMPGTGSIVSAVRTATEREPIVIGKPHKFPFDYLQRTHKLDPNKVLMVGDRCNTDIEFGKNCGLWTLLVLSGVTTAKDLQHWKASHQPCHRKLLPDFYVPGVNDFLSRITQNIHKINT